MQHSHTLRLGYRFTIAGRAYRIVGKNYCQSESYLVKNLATGHTSYWQL